MPAKDISTCLQEQQTGTSADNWESLPRGNQGSFCRAGSMDIISTISVLTSLQVAILNEWLSSCNAFPPSPALGCMRNKGEPALTHPDGWSEALV
eukprot:802594-Pelagomonas_calceolata.AAC.2